jgi:hypothetical protein
MDSKDLVEVAKNKLYSGVCLYHECTESTEEDCTLCDQHQEFCEMMICEYQDFINNGLADYLEKLDYSYKQTRQYFNFQTGETFFASSPNQLFKLFAEPLIGIEFACDIIELLDDDYQLYFVPEGEVSDVVCRYIEKMMKNCIEEVLI